MVLTNIPDDAVYDAYRGKSLTDIPADVLIRRSDGQDDLESMNPNEESDQCEKSQVSQSLAFKLNE